MTRETVLSLYRQLLRASECIPNYSYREYALRRTRDAFRQHKEETDGEKVKELLNQGKTDLEIVKRQAIIEGLYGNGKLIIEVDHQEKASRGH